MRDDDAGRFKFAADFVRGRVGAIKTELGGLTAVAGRAGDPVPALCAQVGDIGLVEHESRELLAVCAGPVWLVPAEQGLAALPIDAATAAWRVTKCP